MEKLKIAFENDKKQDEQLYDIANNKDIDSKLRIDALSKRYDLRFYSPRKWEKIILDDILEP